MDGPGRIVNHEDFASLVLWVQILVTICRSRLFAAKWARTDLNHRIPGYEPGALTRLSYGPDVRWYCTAELNSIASDIPRKSLTELFYCHRYKQR